MILLLFLIMLTISNSKGNNQSFTSYGTNSLSRDMQIRQTGNGTAIIIINK
jgi:hypothetical protein